jgi:N utilization substance protein B
MKRPTLARSLALQTLYEVDMTGHPAGEVLQRRLDESDLSEHLKEFARTIVVGVLANLPTLDALITQYAPEWPLGELAAIDRNLLRMAIWEMQHNDQVTPPIVINEIVELAKQFGGDGSPRFVNGVLGSLVQDNPALHHTSQRED